MEMTREEWRDVLWLLSPWLIGGYLDFLFQGVLYCQFVNYHTYYKDDRCALKLVVYSLAVLTTLKSAQVFLLVWMQSVVYFTDIEGAIQLSYNAWWQVGNAVMVATIGVYVQAFFLHRLKVISGSWLVILPNATIFLLAYIAIILATYFNTARRLEHLARWFAIHFACTFVGDLLLASSTAYFLLRCSQNNGLKQNNTLINSLIRLTFQTCAPATLCAMFNLIFSQAYRGNDKLVSAAFNMALPKLYAISMMWTINARRSLRLVNSSRSISSREPRFVEELEDIQLDTSLSSIQIHTQIETIQHIDDHGDIYAVLKKKRARKKEITAPKQSLCVEVPEESESSSFKASPI
ncbi:hypothetical protein PNOK_0839200 [Pyrrhoderma noxium]|uniref:DUF6534 domain-containing protein n=1 Tax=Pyrrhoderma noxium TaxID=2282107 RepID=A0A286UB07_9AGAM|nr:hypothetical protein PNOK_0839200 [Pyrrhoderma noxium]